MGRKRAQFPTPIIFTEKSVILCPVHKNQTRKCGLLQLLTMEENRFIARENQSKFPIIAGGSLKKLVSEVPVRRRQKLPTSELNKRQKTHHHHNFFFLHIANNLTRNSSARCSNRHRTLPTSPPKMISKRIELVT